MSQPRRRRQQAQPPLGQLLVEAHISPSEMGLMRAALQKSWRPLRCFAATPLIRTLDFCWAKWLPKRILSKIVHHSHPFSRLRQPTKMWLDDDDAGHPSQTFHHPEGNTSHDEEDDATLSAVSLARSAARGRNIVVTAFFSLCSFTSRFL